MKLGTEKAMALGKRKFFSHRVQGAFDLRRRCRPGRYLSDSACGLRLASNQNPLCHSEISFGIRYRSDQGMTWAR
ncbi:hypothetical protein Cflav_PD4846 [Pedosphaera parvula Ellin514]|uniref:Uncharacterized protein n=1 Tax=Pedosphaera parvula (strain Ellin514) TaxID=320771 RepID=B9XEU2_PEDPL|nr:hypothetical protein Cflav_PD4846 [Pedosphaera parvula Ellin514]